MRNLEQHLEESYKIIEKELDSFEIQFFQVRIPQIKPEKKSFPHLPKVNNKIELQKPFWNVSRNNLFLTLFLLQAFRRMDDLTAILYSVDDVDESLFQVIEQQFRKENIQQDILSFLKRQGIIEIMESSLNSRDVRKNSQTIYNALRNLQEHTFCLVDYSQDNYNKQREELIKKIRENILVHLTSIDEKFIRCGSNSLNLLVEIKANLTNQSFEDTRIKDTTLIGGFLDGCNFSGSQFDIYSLLEQTQMDVYPQIVNGRTLQFFKAILVGKFSYEQQNSKLDGDSKSLFLLCFSAYCINLHLVVEIQLSIFCMLKKEQHTEQ